MPYKSCYPKFLTSKSCPYFPKTVYIYCIHIYIAELECPERDIFVAMGKGSFNSDQNFNPFVVQKYWG